MASIYMRGKIWWLSYRVAGRAVDVSLKTQSERVARERKRTYEALSTLGQLRGPSSTPIRPLLESFCKHLKATGTSKGTKNDVSRLRGVFGPCCPALELGRHVPGRHRRHATDTPAMRTGTRTPLMPVHKLEDLSAAAINLFLSERVCEREICFKTANNFREILQRLFQYAIAYHGYVCPDGKHRHPIEAVKRFKVPEPQITWLSTTAIQEQLAAVKDDATTHALVATFIYAGLRRAEALWLTKVDVDFERLLIHVRAKTVNGESWQPKTAKNRVVPMSRTLSRILTNYRSSRNPGKSAWFFPSPQGRGWDPDNFSQHLAVLNRQAALSWSCLDFRHTFGSHLAQRGVSLFKISRLMGNSPDICRRHYAALVPESMHGDVEFEHVAGDSNLSPTTTMEQEAEPRLRLVTT